MELVKKNILSIICGVVALAAIVFHLVVTSSGYSKLEQDGTSRAAKKAELEGLLNADYPKPRVDDNDPGKLSQFPNEKIIKIAEGALGKLAAQAKQMVSQAVQMNSAGYAVIVPGALPAPTDSYKYDFREQYNLVLQRGAKPKIYNNRPVKNLPDEILQSAVPPTDMEIQEAKVKLWNDDYKTKLIMVNGLPVNQKEVVTEYVKATAKFDEDFRRKRALSFKVYLEPTALAISPRLDLAGRTAPAVEDIWFAQMSLWIQQDVCNAIARMNALSTNIPSSPVKHLVALDVRQDASMYVVPGGLTAGAAAMPAPPSDGGEGGDGGDGSVPAAPAGPVRNFALSPTGRVCNPLYDIVQFEFIVVVERQHVRDFLRQVQSGRFITVLDADMQNIDLEEAVSQGYDYGSRPVVEVKIKCEAMFLREWTAGVNGPMPQVVKTMLGIAPPQPATPTPAPEIAAQ